VNDFYKKLLIAMNYQNVVWHQTAITFPTLENEEFERLEPDITSVEVKAYSNL
jgi:hypothetical protein